MGNRHMSRRWDAIRRMKNEIANEALTAAPLLTLIAEGIIDLAFLVSSSSGQAQARCLGRIAVLHILLGGGALAAQLA